MHFLKFWKTFKSRKISLCFTHSCLFYRAIFSSFHPFSRRLGTFTYGYYVSYTCTLWCFKTFCLKCDCYLSIYRSWTWKWKCDHGLRKAEVDPAIYFVHYQLPTTLPIIIAVSIAIYLCNKFFDKKDNFVFNAQEIEKELNENEGKEKELKAS